MATLAKRGAGTPATTGTTWATPTNAVDGTVGTNPATYSTMTNATASAVATIEVTGYDFAAGIGASDTLNSVTVALRHFENNVARFASITMQPYDGVTAIGSAFTVTLGTTAATTSTTFPVTLAQLRSSTFKVRVTITGAASTQSRVFSIDQVDVTADYTAFVYPFPSTGLQGWYDADDATTFSYSGGVNVSQWRDKSGGARHLSGPGVGVAARNGSINGRTSVVVTGANDACSRTPLIAGTDNFAIFIVARRTGGNGTNSCPLYNGNAGNGFAVASRAGSNRHGILVGGIAWNESGTVDDGGQHVITVARTAGTWGHYVDGNSTSLNGSALQTPNTPTDLFVLPDNDGGHAFAGDICEVVVYNVALNTTDRQTVENYLLNRWLPKLRTASDTAVAADVAVATSGGIAALARNASDTAIADDLVSRVVPASRFGLDLAPASDKGTEAPPTVVVNAPADAATTTDATPAFEFTATDPNADAIRYQLELTGAFDAYPYSNANEFHALGWGAGSGYYEWVGQSFMGVAGTITGVKIMLSKEGSPTGTFEMRLYPHGGTFGTSSFPSGGVLATSAPFNWSAIGATASEHTITFTTPYAMSPAVPYVVVFEPQGGGSWDGSNRILFGVDASSPTRAGNLCHYQDGVWQTDGGGTDLCCDLVGVLTKTSDTDANFTNTVNGADSDPFTSGQMVRFTPPADLALGTLSWRVRATDPAPVGSGDYSAWSAARTLTIAAAIPGGKPNVWNGTAWVTKPVKVWTGSAWVEKPMKVWTGSTWELV